jgi:NDP-sugar pyrophosphorylase family protein
MSKANRFPKGNVLHSEPKVEVGQANMIEIERKHPGQPVSQPAEQQKYNAQGGECNPHAIQGNMNASVPNIPMSAPRRTWQRPVSAPDSLSMHQQERVHPMEAVCPIQLNSLIEANRLSLIATTVDHQYDIIDNKTGNRLGSIRQPIGSAYEVELFFGKGGFMGMITSPNGARYFALPGSTVQVQDTELTLEGCAISSNPNKRASQPKQSAAQTHSIQATILGAGLATRFERISGDSTNYSKPAVPLAGRCSVIECIANNLYAHGFSHLIINTYFKPESLKASLSRSQAQRIDYIDETEPSGTAGGLRKMLTDARYQNFLDLSKPLLVVQGDSVTDASFSELMEAHIQHNALVTIGCQEVAEKDVDKFGIIVTDRSGPDGLSGRITGFQEKPKHEEAKSRLGNTGFYIFSPQAFPLVKEIYASRLAIAQTEAKTQGRPIPTEVSLDFANDLFPEILKQTQSNQQLGPFWAQQVDGYWSDIGNPVQYLESIHDLYAGKVNIPLPEDAHRYYQDGIVYWEGAAEIAQQEGAKLKGNVVVALPFQAEHF